MESTKGVENSFKCKDLNVEIANNMCVAYTWSIFKQMVIYYTTYEGTFNGKH